MDTDWTGRRLDVEIGDVAHGGHCVARSEGRVVFVRHALPGERVIAVVTEDRGGSFCRADAVEVLQAAAARVTPPCPYAGPGRCGGCDWQHASAAAQRELKGRVVAEQLRRLAGIDRTAEVEALPGGLLGWRGRVRLVADDDGTAGLRRHRSHEVIDITEHGCAIATPHTLDDAVSRQWRPGSEVEIIRDDRGRVHVCQRPSRCPALVHEHAAGRQWRISAHGFWQVHPDAADTFARAVSEMAQATPGATAWDLYAGVGLFTAVLAEQVGEHGRVLAVESSAAAVSDGERNLADLPQVRWRRGRVANVLGRLDDHPSVVVLDPPRKGAGRPVVEAIIAADPRRVVYVACDPAALARDVATFAAGGYRLAELRAFDAFPMTHHVECVALLTGPTLVGR